MTRSPRFVTVLGLLLAGLACGGGQKAEDDWETLDAGQLGDSLALTTPGGTEIWFTTSRPATDSTGTPCVERTIEIRRDGKKTLVPLLYTGSVPRLLNDSTLEATLWLHCRPMSLYRVDLRNGRPTLVR